MYFIIFGCFREYGKASESPIDKGFTKHEEKQEKPKQNFYVTNPYHCFVTTELIYTFAGRNINSIKFW